MKAAFKTRHGTTMMTDGNGVFCQSIDEANGTETFQVEIDRALREDINSECLKRENQIEFLKKELFVLRKISPAV